MKYVVVTGGVVSGLGKGVTASSIGVLLKACDLRVTTIKIDPYLNTDAGTMSPFEHGEVFVLDDGGEVDLDLGNYERFLNIKLTRDNNITTGKIYQHVIDKERRGDYLGKTVQVVPQITDAIQEWIERVAMIPVDDKEGPPDVCIIELGGTIGDTTFSGHNDSGILDAGDLESMPYIEALGQFSCRVGPGNFCLVHVSLVPVLNAVGEQKTKPTQHSVRGLRGLGLAPNILACRSTKPLDENIKEKLSQFCHVPKESIINLNDVTNIWHIPLLLKEQKAHEALIKLLNLQGIAKEPVLEEWSTRARICDSLHDPVRIAIVGKYTGLSDSYVSVLEALLHASIVCKKKLVVDWVPSSDLEENTKINAPELHKVAWKRLKGANGILVPGGFGDRGVEGKILAARHAREKNVPFLGICLGMQIAVIEFARSVMNLQDANSTEFDPDTTNPCVIFMPEGSKTHMGGTMRLGSRRTYFQVPDCKSAKLYGNVEFVDERHRHRYEVNPDMVGEFEKAGLAFVGKDETKTRMEIVEYPAHPYFVGVQFHPEFKSRCGKPSAPFLGLVGAAGGKLDLLLQNPSQFSSLTKRHMSKNGRLLAKACESGNSKKPAKSLLYNNIYSNGNGVYA
ncbi:CTP synthase isoform X1 [Canna indica]|uniref:CTP synthase n=1 Tax=Canna indica TaxID=4628 RepID=A0AAQ3Q4H4_9LILI|nr:CTP synthase isoform X1 [Canna indica]